MSELRRNKNGRLFIVRRVNSEDGTLATFHFTDYGERQVLARRYNPGGDFSHEHFFEFLDKGWIVTGGAGETGKLKDPKKRPKRELSLSEWVAEQHNAES